MNVRRRELECLIRLQAMTHGLDDILLFLKEEQLLDDVQIKAAKQSSEYPKEVQRILASLQGTKLQLLEYEWNILPVEHIKVFLITDRNQREFRYDEV